MPWSTADTPYADKAVQTQDENTLPNLSSELHSRNTLGIDTHSTTSLLDEKPIELDAAYVCSLPLDCSLIPPQLRPSRSSLPSRRTYKHPRLPYSWPTQARNAEKLEKRVVSFPETVSVGECGTNLTVPTVHQPSMRVVSLPKVETRRLPKSPTMTEDNSSVEYHEVSTDASSLPFSGTGSTLLKFRTVPRSDMPATPSPPSSPESILIIGNGHRVPGTFIRETDFPSDSLFETSEDEAGWITWASSPPRPIPALHGPLSLPYARCPSGAEGTIIENADLPRMIWGLNPDEPHTNPAWNLSSATVANTQLPHEIISAQDQRSSCCTLRSPASPSSRIHTTSDRLCEGNGTVKIKRPAAQYTDTRVKDSHTDYANRQNLWYHTPTRVHGPLVQSSEVGVNWGNHSISSISERHMVSDVKSSAPAFVSSPVASQPALETYPRIFIEPRAGSRLATARRLSAIEIAQRYHIEQQQSTLSIPPTPSSPVWSTVFSSYSPSPLSPQDSSFYDTRQASSERYYTSGLVPLSEKDFSEELRQIEAAKRGLRSTVGLPGVPRPDYNSNGGWNTMDPLAHIPIPQDSYRRSSPVIDVSLILKQQMSSLSHSTNPRIQDTMIYPNLAEPRASEPILQPRNVVGQKPQSIPLTRLIQRRLSSVAEEGSYTNINTSPPNGRYANSSLHLVREEKSQSISTPELSFSKNIGFGSNTTDDSPNKESKTNRKTVVKNANIQDGRPHENIGGNDREKENAFSSVKGTNLKKTAPKKKWRPRKKTHDTSLSSSQTRSITIGDLDD